MNKKEQDKQESKEFLFNLFKGDLEAGKKPKIYTVLRSVSRSGMSRKIDVYYFKGDSKIYLNYHIATLTSFTLDRQSGAVKVGGCGMDMGFNLVYNFSYALFSGEDIAKFKIKGRNGDEFETKDAGYILNQEWL